MHKRMCLLVAPIVFWGCMPALAQQAELLDLQPGHLEIMEEPNGEFFVIARCVPAEEVFQAVAARTGLPVEFAVPIKTYASIYERRSRPIEGWMDRVALYCGGLSCRKEGSHWVVRAADPRFDPSLSDEEIRETFAHTDVKPEQPKEGISTGVLIYRGRFVPPPYRIECVPVEKGFGVAVNGLIMQQTELREKVVPSPPKLPASGKFEDMENLRKYVVRGLYPEVVAKKGAEAAHREVVELVKSQPFVEKVEDGPDLFSIRVKEVGKDFAGQLFPENYDPSTGRIVDMSPDFVYDPELLKAEMEKSAEMLREMFNRGQVTIKSGGAEVAFNGEDTVRYFAEVCALASVRPIREAECLLREIVEDAQLAREMAANLEQDYDKLHETLVAMLPPEQNL